MQTASGLLPPPRTLTRADGTLDFPAAVRAARTLCDRRRHRDDRLGRLSLRDLRAVTASMRAFVSVEIDRLNDA